MKKEFYIPNNFIRNNTADIDIYCRAIYMTMCCYADGRGITFVGLRTIAKKLRINKDTVTKKVRDLIVSGWVGQLEKKRGRVSVFQLYRVRREHKPVSDPIGAKDSSKDSNKEFRKVIEEKFPDLYKKLNDKWKLKN